MRFVSFHRLLASPDLFVIRWFVLCLMIEALYHIVINAHFIHEIISSHPLICFQRSFLIKHGIAIIWFEHWSISPISTLWTQLYIFIPLWRTSPLLSLKAEIFRRSSVESWSYTACCHCLTQLGIDVTVTEALVWSCLILNIHVIMPAALTHFANSWVCRSLPSFMPDPSCGSKGCFTVNTPAEIPEMAHTFWNTFSLLKRNVVACLEAGCSKMSQWNLNGGGSCCCRERWLGRISEEWEMFAKVYLGATNDF